MIPVRGYSGKTVAVLGLGKTGMATAKALMAGNAQVICWDDRADIRKEAQSNGLEVQDLNRDQSFDDVSILVTSPGIAHLYPKPHPIIAKAYEAGVALDNDVGLFFRSFATPDWERFEQLPKVLCVTGSNGKSTTSALIAHILARCGKRVQLGGNIGRPVLDLEPAQEGEIAVLELSSYQLELARNLTPDIAVFTNLSADHLDRHGGRGGYFAAKQRLFALGAPECAIIGVDQIEGMALANQMREDADRGAPVIEVANSKRLSGEGWNIFARKGFLSEWRRSRQVASIDLRKMASLPGAHNHQNACAAYASARALGLAPRKIEAALNDFDGLRHRCQIVGKTRRGALVINDSKATNADATAQALKAFERIYWIAGGQAKEGGISDLAPYFDRIKGTYLIGASAAQFAATLEGHPHQIEGTIEKAVEAALKDAKENDVILLSPAAASFDQFDNFEARGDRFIEIISPHLAPNL